MTIQQAIKYFQTASRLARVLKVSPQAVYQWESIPPKHQWTIAFVSQFQLIPDKKILPADIDEHFFERENYIQKANVSRLLSIANELAKKGRDDVIDAAIVLLQEIVRD